MSASALLDLEVNGGLESLPAVLPHGPIRQVRPELCWFG
jgi:hypothetical protein